jgi:hypothetical protein
MTFQVVAEDDIYEDNDTLETAWYPGYSWEGEWLWEFDDLGIQFDEDWYQIEVSPGCERVLVDCLFTHAEGDIDIAIMDSLGKWIAASTSVTDNEYFDVPDLAEGTYYIFVYYGNGGNRYDLWWDDVELPTIFHAPQWLSNSCVEGSDAPSQTVDIWEKEVPLSFSISDDASG